MSPLARRLARGGGNSCLHGGIGVVGIRPLFGDSHDARVAELVDAHDSDSCPSNGVQVQLLPRAPSFKVTNKTQFHCLKIINSEKENIEI